WQLAHTCLFHIPGWPMAPAEPSGWVIAGLIAVQGLVLLYLLLLALRPHRPPYDWAAGTQVVTERRNTKRAEKTQREQGGKKGDTD
ncbi:MAG: hypothetical protein KC708_26955, partial [Anaerolineae bacterium]|nr:hypothetical protein [Anaerolineae bacterium]